MLLVNTSFSHMRALLPGGDETPTDTAEQKYGLLCPLSLSKVEEISVDIGVFGSADLTKHKIL